MRLGAATGRKNRQARYIIAFSASIRVDTVSISVLVIYYTTFYISRVSLRGDRSETTLSLHVLQRAGTHNNNLDGQDTWPADTHDAYGSGVTTQTTPNGTTPRNTQRDNVHHNVCPPQPRASQSTPPSGGKTLDHQSLQSLFLHTACLRMRCVQGQKLARCDTIRSLPAKLKKVASRQQETGWPPPEIPTHE